MGVGVARDAVSPRADSLLHVRTVASRAMPLLTALLLLISVSSCLAEGPPVSVKVDFEVAATPSVVAFFTGNTYGTMRRSSCSDPQLGGFERRRTYILQCLSAWENSLVLDSGNLFNCNCAQDKLESWYMIAAFNMMTYDAVGLGPKDFVFGLEHLKALEKNARFPFLCANMLDVETRDPVFDAFLIEGSTEATVFVTSVISTDEEELLAEWTRDADGNRTIEMQEPVEALEPILASHATIANVVILLAQMSLDEALKLAESIPSIDLILLSDREQHEDLIHGTTIISPVGTKSKAIKAVALYFDENGSADRYNIETFPIVEEIEHSYSMVRLYDRLAAAQSKLSVEDLLQPTFYTDKSIYNAPAE
ncbi:MAG: hypothetical protein JW941_07790 [Candidatus Coatesbacteria bacterium]|nr:hypothetical protein [Candidatus Coatesbacteria bacterium]